MHERTPCPSSNEGDTKYGTKYSIFIFLKSFTPCVCVCAYVWPLSERMRE